MKKNEGLYDFENVYILSLKVYEIERFYILNLLCI